MRRGTSNGKDDVNVQEGLGDGIDDRSTDGRDDIGVEEMYSDTRLLASLPGVYPS